MWFYIAPRKIVYGEDSISELDEILAKSVLIVTDETLIELGIVQKVVERLENRKIKVTIFDKVSFEPTIPLAKEGLEYATKEEVDWIIAVGGGSVIDCAKAIWVLYENPGKEIVSVFPEDPLTLRSKARMIAIPTTSGTGSEANWAIVITDPDTKQKLSVAHRELVPDIAIVDPILTVKLPADLTAAVGVDVLAHAIEAYTVEWKNVYSDAMALQAVKMVFDFLPDAVSNLDNLEYREKMHNAATIAGIAIGNSQIGGAHAMAHSAGAIFKLAHSEMVAVTLPHMMKYCIEDERTAKLYSEIASYIGISAKTPEEGAERLIIKIEDLIDQIGLKTKFSDFGISKKQFEENLDTLINFALNDTGSLVNPRELNEEEIRRMFLDMLGEEKGGYRGKILHVNLTSGVVKKEVLDMKAAKRFVGGSGLAAYYYFKFLNKKNVDALSPENILIFMTGPLTGLPTSCSGRYTICSKSPLTGFWGEANSGGHFGPELKFAGFDGIIIEGASEKPVYLHIENGQIELRDASKYWGLGTFKTQELLFDDLNDDTYKIACIGQAGENLVKFASIMNNGGRAAGRTGLGAIMGSKKLKAIAVKGTDRYFMLPDEFKDKSNEALDIIKDDFMFGLTRDLGTSGYVDLAVDMYGDMPIRNWSESSFEAAYDISGASMAETILVGRKGCFRCPIECGRIIEIPEGKYKLERTKGPEYETIAAFGTNLQIGDLEAISYANQIANDYGMDTISTGTTIGVLLDLVTRGVIDDSIISDDIKYEFGNIDTLMKLLEMIAYREGIGNFLAEGSKRFAENFLQVELAPQIAGLEVPFHDPRAFSGMAIQYMTSPRGACHSNGDAYLVQQGTIFPELEIDDLPEDRFESSGIAKQMSRIQSYRQLYNAMTICILYNPPVPIVSDLLGMAMNEKFTYEDLIKFGDRIFALKRILNLRLGWKPELQKLPKVMLQKLDGPTEGNVPDVQTQLNEWYEYRHYNPVTGCPNIEELERLEITDLVKCEDSLFKNI
ncbi:MAG: iron-containing alcohol dehydrogenase [Candidatus Heimdallarchaeaceae archaeon]|jgi:aldehyde:ferredoxin oxidoreductase